MIWRMIGLIMIVALIAGCSTVTTVMPDGTRISYMRIGQQEITGVSGMMTTNGYFHFSLAGQKSDGSAQGLADALNAVHAIVQTAVQAAVAP